MKESEFQGAVIAMAERFGWRVWHVAMPMRPVGGNRFVPEPRGAGLPDLIMIHPKPARLILAELKREDGELSDAQREFLHLAAGLAERLVACDSGSPSCSAGMRETRPVGVYSWWPKDMGEIEATLRSKVAA